MSIDVSACYLAFFERIYGLVTSYPLLQLQSSEMRDFSLWPVRGFGFANVCNVFLHQKGYFIPTVYILSK